MVVALFKQATILPFQLKAGFPALALIEPFEKHVEGHTGAILGSILYFEMQ